MKRYKKYKDSGVQWIGEIPEEWEKNKISRVFRTIGSGGTPDSNNELYYNGNISWLNTGDLNDDTIKYTNRKINDLAIKKFSTLKLYPKNSLVIAMYGATIGKLGITDIETTTNQACCVLANPIDMSIKYMYYWFLAGREYIINLSQGGGQPNISQQIIKDLYFFKPSINEQTQIAAYLDHKTSQLETIISKKEELIETLNASRTKIISETVTKGLDKNVEMKDSGVEWIGEIPRHWEVNRLKFICDINPQKSEVRLSKSSKVSFIPMENISLNTLNLDTEKELREVYGGYTYFRDGDIIFAKVTPCFENGNMSIVRNLTNGVGFGSTELNVLRVNEKIIDREFLYYIIQSDKFKNQAIANMYGVAGLKRISTKFIEDYHILLPSINEQKKIIEFLNIKIEYIDKIISKTEEQITLLKKAKQKLITEVVTGKIDVTDL